MKKRKKTHIVLAVFGFLVLFLWINNTSLFTNTEESYKLLAHRGLAQTFDISKVEWDTNTAEIIYEPEHGYLENTIASMKAAFDYGADGGKTFPFRGKGIGLMPELQEVLSTFPEKDLLIHLKDGDMETTKILWTYLEKNYQGSLSQITVYGGHEEMMYLREQNSSIRVLSKKLLKDALLKYELLGWTGYIPRELHNLELHIPLKYAKFLWGWPHKFVERMDSVNTRVVIVAGNGKWSEGFDTLDAIRLIPKSFNGYVWTNRIDVVSEN